MLRSWGTIGSPIFAEIKKEGRGQNVTFLGDFTWNDPTSQNGAGLSNVDITEGRLTVVKALDGTVLLDDTGTVLMVRRATVGWPGGCHLDNNVSDGRVPRVQEAISLVGERRTGQDVTEWSRKPRVHEN